MAGLLTKDIKLGYATTSGATSYTDIANLQECPALGGSVDKIDVTCLADGNKKYINGIKDYGDLAFKFLYDNSTATSNYRVLKNLENKTTYWQVSFPDGTKFTFSGEVSLEIDSASVNGALTFTATISLNSDMTVTNPTA